MALARCNVTMRLGFKSFLAQVALWPSRSWPWRSRVFSSVPCQRTSFNSPGPSMEIPTPTLYRWNMRTCSSFIKRPVGLDGVRTELLQTPGPKCLQVPLRD